MSNVRCTTPNSPCGRYNLVLYGTQTSQNSDYACRKQNETSFVATESELRENYFSLNLPKYPTFPNGKGKGSKHFSLGVSSEPVLSAN